MKSRPRMTSITTPYIPSVEEMVPLPAPDTSAGTHLHTRILLLLLPPLRILAGLFLAPLLLIVASLSFLVVLADFSLFRLQNTGAGHPAPKGLWEF
jgi:hypothetical protein